MAADGIPSGSGHDGNLISKECFPDFTNENIITNLSGPGLNMCIKSPSLCVGSDWQGKTAGAWIFFVPVLNLKLVTWMEHVIE